jgi:cerevisin
LLPGSAPVLSSVNAVEIPDNYIVVFKKHVDDASAAIHQNWVQEVHFESENQRTELRKRGQFPITTDIFEGLKHTYNIGGHFKGYSGHFDEDIIEQVRNHPDVSESSFVSCRIKIYEGNPLLSHFTHDQKWHRKVLTHGAG